MSAVAKSPIHSLSVQNNFTWTYSRHLGQMVSVPEIGPSRLLRSTECNLFGTGWQFCYETTNRRVDFTYSKQPAGEKRELLLQRLIALLQVG
jgi:hypothetical protein